MPWVIFLEIVVLLGKLTLGNYCSVGQLILTILYGSSVLINEENMISFFEGGTFWEFRFLRDPTELEEIFFRGVGNYQVI